MECVVLDASVIVALLQKETFNEGIAPYFDRTLYVSTVNVVEVAIVCRRKNPDVTPDFIREQLNLLRITIVPFSLHHAMVAANFQQVTGKKGLSLGDNACLALGKELNALVLTADKAWITLNLNMAIKLIR